MFEFESQITSIQSEMVIYSGFCGFPRGFSMNSDILRLSHSPFHRISTIYLFLYLFKQLNMQICSS